VKEWLQSYLNQSGIIITLFWCLIDFFRSTKSIFKMPFPAIGSNKSTTHSV